MIMKEVIIKDDCCGCFACFNICPHSSISMCEDEEGFRYPQINQETCTDCGLCQKVCPVLQPIEEVPFEQEACLVQHKDETVLRESTSGGAFTAIATWIINQGGVVFGAAFEDGLNVKHVRVDTISDLSKFRNSKYVQSDIGNTFTQVKKLLKEGRLVCFSGTPCQIEGLDSFLLRKKCDNLILVDLVCRAVPSPKVLREYVTYQEKRNKSKVENLQFRDKHFGYKYSNLSIRFSDSTSYHEGIDTDKWLRSFFSGINVRPSCFDCHFKKRYRVSDITIWDCFDVNKFSNKLDNDKGVTRALVHSEKGKAVVSNISDYADILNIDVDAAIDRVKELVNPATRNPKREDFFKDLNTIGFERTIEKYFPITIKNKLERRIRRVAFKSGLYLPIIRLYKSIKGETKRS